ncbi:hypothetical protein POKO110462_21855 [Pontibacter korlensis]|uniref:DUF1440 domain-containing protein n=1 Tax=Pontibacter korlensis TaxID=400092 RepID=A0A0E3UYQ0_9BACT|nr:hypothetical protein [Pontibacter korlensis]AKD05337.1 hypothetical protein PKOR_22630 [Pontibacter korlensis]
MAKDKTQDSLAILGDAIGKGILAGLVGTAAITAAQMIEMQLTKREQSQAPSKVAGQVLGVTPSNKEEAAEQSGEPAPADKSNEQVKEEHTKHFSQMMHWQYGTSWGVARGLLSIAGVTGWPATAAHFGAVWSTALVMLPAANASEPINKWSPKQIALDVLEHGVYAIAAGLFFDYINQSAQKAPASESSTD